MVRSIKGSAIVFVTVLLVWTTLLAGCAKKSNTGGGAGAAEQKLRMLIASEPPSLDPGLAQDNNSSTVLRPIYDALTRLDEKGEPKPAAAEKWDVSADGLKYTFHLRSNAKWSNGDPVKASDFEYAWKRALDPAMTPPAPYAYQLYYLKNAEEYNTKKMTDASQIGVKAKDDFTLDVELKSPTPYFLSLVSFYTYFPLNEKAVKANPAFAAEANTMVTNGPFLLKEWKHNDSLTLTKNPNYHSAADIKLTEVNMKILNDAGTMLNMYNTNQIDWAGRPTNEFPVDQLPKLKQDKNMNLQIKGIASTYYYEFNTKAEPFDNAKIRKAFSLSIDRKSIVDKITLGDQTPAHGLVPPGIRGETKTFREEVKDDYFKDDVAEAKKLLETGLKEKGYAKLPAVTLIYNKSEAHKKIAEAVVDMWRQNLGVDVKLEVQEFGVYIKNRQNGNFQIARAGWGADYNDPMTYIDLLQTGGGNNNSKYSNPEYDKLIKDTYGTSDQGKRMKTMAQAEKMMIADMPIAPIYYYTGIWAQKPYVKNVFVDYKGDVDFIHGYIEK
ncbi:peptide ABC transporter substrate-binding protein [Paenibacillus ginsengarvi]|uniref:Peptide ABC transporter substrate-binding protein n=1 Tax=Paenibacillus ginsengarvi TaxID=400777 RepID=A0A3B0CWR4_9BACL|nr:peptide ABC transporter substrate-binding protein [Paenibacillus ginsengarvi]RKN86909.1 peptide ABC transporter substrate-binding protein [Paenibacillus ginsengarvi]